MKAGDVVSCPKCGEKTVVKVEKIMSGWKVTGERFVCALCSAELGKPGEEKNAGNASGARARLAALLGGDDVEKVSISPDEGFRRGCRNCGHLLEHPFKLLCALTQREVDPMFECQDFVDKKTMQ